MRLRFSMIKFTAKFGRVLQASKKFQVFLYLFRQSSQWTSQQTHVYLNMFKRSWLAICDWWISVRFVSFCVLRLVHVIVLFRAIIDQFVSKIFLIFLTAVFCKNKATFASFSRQNVHTPSRFPPLFLNSLFQPSRESLSVLHLWAKLHVISFHSTPTQMIDGTGRPKIPSTFAKRAARYNEFRCKWRSIY